MPMKRILNIIAFNAGEVTPELDARIDLDKYEQGCRTMENMLLFVQGGARRMPGTTFVTKVKGD